MSALRQLDISIKLYACFALLACVQCAVLAWIVTQLSQLTGLTVAVGQNFSAPALAVSSAFRQVSLWAGAAMVCTVAVAAALAWWLRGQVLRPRTAAQAAARRIAAGDLGTPIAEHERDTLLTSMQEMNDHLIASIAALRADSAAIASASGDLVRCGRELGARSAQQNTWRESAVAALCQQDASLQRNTALAQTASKHMQSTAHPTGEASAASDALALTLAAVDAAARQLADLSATIDAIAVHGNIVALNAAMEAAHAGGNGAPYGAVATALHELAQRAAAAARGVSDTSCRLRQQANAGRVHTTQLSQSMHDVESEMRAVRHVVAELDAAHAVQRAALVQAQQALHGIDREQRQAHALGQQISAASTALRDRSGDITRVLATFSLGPAHIAAPLIHLAHSNPDRLRPAAAATRARTTPLASVRACEPL